MVVHTLNKLFTRPSGKQVGQAPTDSQFSARPLVVYCTDCIPYCSARLVAALLEAPSSTTVEGFRHWRSAARPHCTANRLASCHPAHHNTTLAGWVRLRPPLPTIGGKSRQAACQAWASARYLTVGGFVTASPGAARLALATNPKDAAGHQREAPVNLAWRATLIRARLED
jgi:hypothetical protein